MSKKGREEREREQEKIEEDLQVLGHVFKNTHTFLYGPFQPKLKIRKYHFYGTFIAHLLKNFISAAQPAKISRGSKRQRIFELIILDFMYKREYFFRKKDPCFFFTFNGSVSSITSKCCNVVL